MQELNPLNLPKWHSFILSQILFSDDADFSLNGYVNKKNWRISYEEQPEEVHELPLHPKKKTTVASGILGSYFFKNYVDEIVTVNDDYYAQPRSTSWKID